jgi:Golgi nucleoside diphosphatase
MKYLTFTVLDTTNYPPTIDPMFLIPIKKVKEPQASFTIKDMLTNANYVKLLHLINYYIISNLMLEGEELEEALNQTLSNFEYTSENFCIYLQVIEPGF